MRQGKPAAIEIVSRCRNVLGESPVWSARENALYWTDIREPAIYRYDPAARATRKWPMPELVGAVVLRQRGGLIVGLQSGLYAFDPLTAVLEEIHRFEGAHPDDRTNDSRCDPDGRLWFSRMRDFGRAPTGGVYRMDETLRPVPMISGVAIPNAISFSAAGDRLYFADTPTGRLDAIVIDRESGNLAGRRCVLAEGAAPGKPDGATVDAEGHVWNARFGGGCLVRCPPDGSTFEVVELPVSRPTSCSFGGRDLDRLYVTTATQGLDPAALEREPLAGMLLCLDVGIKGREEPAFRG